MRTSPFITCVLALLLLPPSMAGKPARRTPVRYQQGDGSVVEVRLHGDEWNHYATDAAGRLLEADAGGVFRLSARPVPQVPVRQATVRPRGTETAPQRVLVIPLEFEDLPFSFPDVRERLERLLNQEGYAENGAAGSVRDYYFDNSHGAYAPVFDVTDPVRLTKSVSYYGADIYQGGERVSDRAPELALYEACAALDETTDFSAYDGDGDGLADLVFYYYPGIDQADGGPRETIWSHQWDVRYSSFTQVREARFDGTGLGMYGCTSELAGVEGRFCGLAPTCHELAHVLGLPDFYDTDGTENGLAGGLYDFSLMSDGLFPDGNPPALNTLEKILLGWMDAEELLPFPEEGQLTIGPVRDRVAYRNETGTEGEYFLYEYRDGQGWDAILPEGLLVYHVDRSERTVAEAGTAAFLWERWRDYNNLNANGSHPCFYLVPSASPASLNYLDREGIAYPGISGVLASDPLDWEGAFSDIQLTNIQLEAQEGVSLFVLRGHDANINGRVLRRDGTPVSGAVVAVEQSEIPPVTTGADGFFFLPLPEGTREGHFTLSVSRAGFRKQRVTATQVGRGACARVQLIPDQEAETATLVPYDILAERLFFPLPSQSYGDCMGAVRFSPEALFQHGGRRLTEVTFCPYLPEGYAPAEAIWLVVDFGKRRVLTRKLEETVQGPLLPNVVDLTDADLRIPEGVPVYIGYGVEGASYPFMLGAARPGHAGLCYYAPLNLEASEWTPLYTEKGNGGYMDLLLHATVQEVPEDATLDRMGFASIDPVKALWHAGETFPLQLKEAAGREPETVDWTVDGRPVDAAEVRLTSGRHRVVASLTYADGASERISLFLPVGE